MTSSLFGVGTGPAEAGAEAKQAAANAREVRNVSILPAVGIGMEGFRDILGVVEGPKEGVESRWSCRGHLGRARAEGVPPSNRGQDAHLEIAVEIGGRLR